MTVLQIFSATILGGMWVYLLSMVIRGAPVTLRLTLLGLIGLLFGATFPRYDPDGLIGTFGALLAMATLVLGWRRSRRGLAK